MRAPLVRTRYNAIGRQRQVHGRPSCVSAIPNLTDLRPAPADILGDVLAGLAQRPRRLPSKYFYDHRGSVLFELITRQPEYYVTRTELALLAASANQITRKSVVEGKNVSVLVDLGGRRNIQKKRKKKKRNT